MDRRGPCRFGESALQVGVCITRSITLLFARVPNGRVSADSPYSAELRPLLDHVHAARRILAQLRNAEAAHDDAPAVKLGRRLGVETRQTTKDARALHWTVCASAPR